MRAESFERLTVRNSTKQAQFKPPGKLGYLAQKVTAQVLSEAGWACWSFGVTRAGVRF
jgi:hypothetical protein